jgi:hypothetical protein
MHMSSSSNDRYHVPEKGDHVRPVEREVDSSDILA